MKSEAATGKAIVTEDIMASGVINRIDLATIIIDTLKSEGRATRKELTAIDPSQESAYEAAKAVASYKL